MYANLNNINFQSQISSHTGNAFPRSRARNRNSSVYRQTYALQFGVPNPFRLVNQIEKLGSRSLNVREQNRPRQSAIYVALSQFRLGKKYSSPNCVDLFDSSDISYNKNGRQLRNLLGNVLRLNFNTSGANNPNYKKMLEALQDGSIPLDWVGHH